MKENISILKWVVHLMCACLLVILSACGHKDSCNIPCFNGTCVNNSCNCNLGFEGDSCTTLTTAKFIGSWNAFDSCQTKNYGYTATIAASSSIVNEIIITNFGEYGTSFIVKADVSGMTFTVPQQIVEGITLSGSGVIDTVTKTIAVSFNAEDELHNTDACAGVWNKVQ